MLHFDEIYTDINLDTDLDLENNANDQVIKHKLINNNENCSDEKTNQKIKKIMEEWYVFMIGILFVLIFGIMCNARSKFNHLSIPKWDIIHLHNNDEIIFYDKIMFSVALIFVILTVPTIWYVYWYFTAIKNKRDAVTNIDIIKCFSLYFVFVILAIGIGHENNLHKNGFGSSFWALIFGILVTNLWKTDLNSHWFNIIRKDADFFIKLSLVCMYIKIPTLLQIAGRSILLSWIIHVPLVYSMTFIIANILKMNTNNNHIKISLMAGCITICGSSAVTAIRDLMITFPNLFEFKECIKKDSDIVIAISSMLTIGYMLLVPFICRLLPLNDDVIGSAIGTSIDSTGQVIASAMMYSDRAKEIAQIVKMIQNIAIAPLCVFITIQNVIQNVIKNKFANKQNRSIKSIICIAWHTFPKFVLGFLLNSIILSFVIMPISGNNASVNADFVIRIGAFIGEWFEVFAFFCIGLKLNYREIQNNFINTSIKKWIVLYIIVQSIDTFIAFCFAYLIFELM